jgi:hypothetical protein
MQKLGFNISGLGTALRARTWHLQRTFNWQLMMPSNFGGAIGYLVSQFCQDVQIGDYSISELSMMRYGAFQRFYAGVQAIESIDLVFVVPSDNSVLDYFYGWYEKMIDSRGYYFPKNNYRRDVYIILYDRSGVESTRFKVTGAFPTGRPRYHPSYETDDVLRTTVTLSVDAIEPSSLIGSFRKGVTNLLAPVTDRITGLLG